MIAGSNLRSAIDYRRIPWTRKRNSQLALYRNAKSAKSVIFLIDQALKTTQCQQVAWGSLVDRSLDEVGLCSVGIGFWLLFWAAEGSAKVENPRLPVRIV